MKRKWKEVLEEEGEIAEDMGVERRLCSLRADIGNCLTEYAYPMLFQLWQFSYIEGGVLVLPKSAADTLSENHPEGYQRGVWYLVFEYEKLVSQALLSNSNPHAPGHRQPKTFSAWPRQHNRELYHRASSFRAHLPEDIVNITLPDRVVYESLIGQWLNSITHISKISGNTRLNLDQLVQLKVALEEIPSTLEETLHQ